jgi:hypothetical protein
LVERTVELKVILAMVAMIVFALGWAEVPNKFTERNLPQYPGY